MQEKIFEDSVDICEGCQATYENQIITVKGPKGESSRKLYDPSLTLKIVDNKITLSTNNFGKKNKKLLNTFKAHIKNLFRGVNEGHIYKLKICSGHFPMTVTINNRVFEIKNFIGEKVPRRIIIQEGTDVKIDGTEIVVESINKEQAGQAAALIEQLTRRPGFDKRIFQDGIYLTEKDGKIIK
ncbi:MAG: 50S ribosomal protein L6 [archaeon]